MNKKIALGGDHAGFEYKNKIADYLKNQDFEIDDMGPYTGESVDYPDFAHPVAVAVEKGDADFGVLICGSGNGVAMVANKHRGIRAAVCWDPELASLARQHNNANVLCIPARFIPFETAEAVLEAFFSAGFEGGRHGRRVDKINC